ncbi:unnamed protein product [Ceutorhynchus assimilis]|uniref:Peptidase S1 domain-containing protein n=1 Tax=Ceutorhynchus assimilis TaxID=467358 RepID=A0A9N9MZC0_9CUCU|nr:unnamed protein product [Ceutorhynchus assimilis]
MRIGMWKYVFLLVAVAAYSFGGDLSVSEQGQNYNFLVKMVRKDTKEKVAVGTLLSPTHVLTSAKLLVLSPSRYEANLMARQRRRKRFMMGIWFLESLLGNVISGAIESAMSRRGDSINHDLLNNGDVQILTITVPHKSRSALTFVKLLIPSDIRSSKSSWPSEWHTGRFKFADMPCENATVLGLKQGATVDLIGAKNCAEQFNIQLNEGQFCSLNKENVFCDAYQQGGPVMCGDFQVGILIPGLYCNGEPLQFASIGYYINGIAKAMKSREDEKPLPNDNSTVPTPTTTDSEGICLEPNANIFVMFLIVILL